MTRVRDRNLRLMLQPGGGAVLRVVNRLDLFGQIDLRHIFMEDEGDNTVRVSAGVRLNIR